MGPRSRHSRRDSGWLGTDRRAQAAALTLVGGQAAAVGIPGFMALSAAFSPEPAFVYLACGAGWVAEVLGLLALRFGRVFLASNLVVWGLWCVVAALTVHAGAGSEHVGAFAPVIIGAAGLVRSVRSTLGLTLGSICLVLGVYLLQRFELHPVPLPAAFDVVAPVMQLLAAGGFASGLIHAFSRALERLRQRETELERSEARYTQLFEQCPDGMLLLSPTGRVLAANSAACRMLGSLEDGVSFLELPFEPASLSVAQEFVSGNQSTGALLLQRKERPLVMAVNATRLDKPVGGVQLTVRDVTEAKRAEEAQRALEQRLRRSERMEAFGQLAGGVSHDFNNILTGLLGHLELTRYRLEDLSVDDPTLQQSLAAVERSAERGAALTKQLLQFSRQRDVDVGKTDLARAVWESEKLLRPLIREDIVLQLDVQASGPVGISASAVGQIVMNLVINACDAMTQGGTVHLRTSQHEVRPGRSELSPGPYVLLEVEDTGTGIPESVLPRIFEPFFTTKPAGVGTGLGLSTVHGIVRRAGGHIEVSSRSQRGTTFRIYLPQLAGSPTPLAGTPVPLQTRQGNQELVLVCEDESTIRDVISEVLTQHGFRVYATGSPRAALEQAKKLGSELTLVISDVIMPEMNGPQLVTELKAHLPNLRVLYISGYTAGLLKDLGIRDDDARLLSKPFSPSNLLERVHALLSSPS